jgi:hypothetical protein
LDLKTWVVLICLCLPVHFLCLLRNTKHFCTNLLLTPFCWCFSRSTSSTHNRSNKNISIGIGLKFFESQVKNFLSFFIQNVCCENVCERKRSCRHSPQLTHCLQVPKIEIWHLPCKTDMKNWKKGKYCASFKCLGFRQSNMFCYETFLFRKFGEKIEQKND